jgi:hypothetical protein
MRRILTLAGWTPNRACLLGLLAAAVAAACSSSSGPPGASVEVDAGFDGSFDATFDEDAPADGGVPATDASIADALPPHDASPATEASPGFDASPEASPDAAVDASAPTDGATDAPVQPEASAPDGGGTDSGVVGFGAAVSVAVGDSDACAVTAAGAVVCWGSNTGGALGTGSTTPPSSATPVQVAGLTSGIQSVSVGDGFACALTTAGAVWCWGTNGSGQLGVPTTTASSPSPVQVTGLSSGITAISCGESASCAINTSGGVVCWGADDSYQLGDPGVSNLSTTPVPVSGLSSGVTSVSMGDSSACAVTSSGAVMCWGANNEGQLGNGTQDSPTPVAVQGLAANAASVAVGWDAACARLTTGALQCWGYNATDVLGEASTTASFSATPVTVSLSGATSVSLDYIDDGAACAITTGGGLLCWGYDAYGELGNGQNTNTPTPQQVTGLTSGVSSVSMGADSACAVYACGVKCWGNNPFGELGVPTSTLRTNTPVDVALLGASSCP